MGCLLSEEITIPPFVIEIQNYAFKMSEWQLIQDIRDIRSRTCKKFEEKCKDD